MEQPLSNNFPVKKLPTFYEHEGLSLFRRPAASPCSEPVECSPHSHIFLKIHFILMCV